MRGWKRPGRTLSPCQIPRRMVPPKARLIPTADTATSSTKGTITETTKTRDTVLATSRTKDTMTEATSPTARLA